MVARFEKFWVLTLALLSVEAASAASITKQVVRQQWPWDQKVRIDYRLECGLEERHAIDVAIADTEGNALTVLRNSFTGDLDDVACGDHTIFWDPSASGLSELSAASYKFTLSPHTPIGPKYMILDISAGNGDDAVYTVSYSETDPMPASMTWQQKDTTACVNTQIVLRRVEAGTYLMGSPETEAGRSDTGSEKQHVVILTNDFYLAVLPTTVSQYNRVWNGTKPTNYYSSDQHPMQNFAWSDFRNHAVATTEVGEGSWLDLLRKKTTGGAALPEGYVFDIPTEAQWEYACRAGTTTAWNNGADCATNAVGVDANLNLLGLYTPIGSGGSSAFGNVGQKLPNAWGLYDCHGNIGELTADGIDTSYTTAVIEPATGRSANLYCVVRGGCYVNAWAVHCRSAARIMSNQSSSRNSAPADGVCWFWQTARFAFIRPRQNNRW